MYRVLDNGKPATSKVCFPDVLFPNDCWEKCDFPTWGEAVQYAEYWCIPYGITLTEEKPSDDYSGYGDIISIVEVESE